MIPKIMHFIWFGRKPPYVEYSISAFSRANPGFQVNFEDDERKWSSLTGEISEKSGKYRDEIVKYTEMGRKPIQILSNILRLELLNTYGGIYLDCDCFPIGGFDDYIMKDDFVVCRNNTVNYIRRDCFFMGKTLESEDVVSYETFNAREIRISDRLDRTDIGFLVRKKMFVEGRLKPLESGTRRYIEHFNMEAWKK